MGVCNNNNNETLSSLNVFSTCYKNVVPTPVLSQQGKTLARAGVENIKTIDKVSRNRAFG